MIVTSLPSASWTPLPSSNLYVALSKSSGTVIDRSIGTIAGLFSGKDNALTRPNDASQEVKAQLIDAIFKANGIDGDKVTNGNPFVKNAEVIAEVVSHGKEDKIVVFKYKAKKNYRRKQGHRQPFTALKIVSVK